MSAPRGQLAERASSSGGVRSTQHIGITVSDIEQSISFWEGWLGIPARNRRILEAPHIAALVGYPGIRIDSCVFDLPGGNTLELLEYMDRDEEPYEPGTAHPGSVHVCLQVEDIDQSRSHALVCGATPVGDAPVEIPVGPNKGARMAFVRAPDGVSVELFQAPPKR